VRVDASLQTARPDAAGGTVLAASAAGTVAVSIPVARVEEW
jgi:hypothetical protein